MPENGSRPVPIGAEARGRLRRWKQDLADQYARVYGAYQRADTRTVASAFAACGTTGRRRAFQKLNRRFAPYARLEFVRLDKPPLAIWAVLRPRERVILGDAPDDPGLQQDCVVIDCVVAGQLADNFVIGTGLWSLEASDHSLGRLFQREPGCDAAGTMLAAHRALLNADPQGFVLGGVVLVPAGTGVFVCQLAGGTDVSTGNPDLHVRARTWVHGDQLRPEQERRIIAPDPQSDIANPWLVPEPLRHIEALEGFWRVDAFGIQKSLLTAA